jgi:ABC-type oligopeptide transport system, periplasmic component
MRIKAIVILLIAVMAATIISGCGEKGTNDTITALFGSEPSTLDPGLMQSIDETTYAVHLFEGLTRDDHGEYVGGVAKNWDISDNLTTYTFHLRDDAVWTDGKPVRAQDFEYAWKRNLDPRTASPYAYILYYIKGGEEFNSFVLKENATDAEKKKYVQDLKKLEDQVQVKALDDRTLEVTLVAPVAYFLELCACQPTYFPLRKDVIDAKGEEWSAKANTYVSNGPYKLQQWKHNDVIVCVKNDKYMDKDKVKLNEIHFKLMDDINAALSATEAGDIDVNYAHIPSAEIPKLVKEGKAKTYPELVTYYYNFNVKKAPFDDVKVRKAFALAIDRTFIVEKVTMAQQVPAVGIVPYGFIDPITKKDFRDADQTKYLPETANVEEAKKLLAEAGYPDGKGFPEVEFIYNTFDTHKKIAEAIQEQLKVNLGINIKLSNKEASVYMEEMNKGNFNFCVDAFGTDYGDPMSFIELFTSKSGNNSTGWGNAEYDELVESARNTDDQKVRFDSMHKAENILMGDMPVMPIYYFTITIMEPKNLKNQYKGPTGIYYLDRAYFDKSATTAK